MPETKSKATVTTSEEPKTISDIVAEVRSIMKKIKLQFRPGTTDDEIIFGLQHTIADYRTNDADKGKPFPITVASLSKISSYYQNLAEFIKGNQSDMELLPLFVDALQDMTITGDESKYIMRSSREILARTKQDAHLVYSAELRDEHPTEVNQDSRLLIKDFDNTNEIVTFKMNGKENVFMKQYLASLLEPIRETTEAAQYQDSNKTLPQGQVTTNTASIVKNK